MEGSGFVSQNHRNNRKAKADPVGMLCVGENVKLSIDWHPWQLEGLPTSKFMALSLIYRRILGCSKTMHRTDRSHWNSEMGVGSVQSRNLIRYELLWNEKGWERKSC